MRNFTISEKTLQTFICGNWKLKKIVFFFLHVLLSITGNELFRHWIKQWQWNLTPAKGVRWTFILSLIFLFSSLGSRRFSIKFYLVVIKIDRYEKFTSLSYRDRYDRTSETKFCIVCCKFITSSQTFGIWKDERKNFSENVAIAIYDKHLTRQAFGNVKSMMLFASRCKLSQWRNEHKFFHLSKR